MKPKTDKTCGTCAAYRLGILEVYCRRFNKSVKPETPACKEHKDKPEIKELKLKTIKKEPAMEIENKPKPTATPIPVSGRKNNPLIRTYNAARSLKISTEELNQKLDELEIQVFSVGEGKVKARAINKSDLKRLKAVIPPGTVERKTKVVKEETHALRLDSITDKQLAEELRRRGYEVRCTKLIEL